METPANPLRPTGAEMEYSALRDEMLRRVDQRQQVLSVTLTLAGAFLGIGWGSGSVALLIYPPLAALLAAAWSQNEVQISRINLYIREQIEGVIPGLGYGRFNREQNMRSRLGAWPVDILAIGGVFLVTQLMAVGLSMFHFGGALVEWLLIGLAIVSIIGLVRLLDYVRRIATQ
jgi:hypothetical protein